MLARGSWVAYTSVSGTHHFRGTAFQFGSRLSFENSQVLSYQGSKGWTSLYNAAGCIIPELHRKDMQTAKLYVASL